MTVAWAALMAPANSFVHNMRPHLKRACKHGVYSQHDYVLHRELTRWRAGGLQEVPGANFQWVSTAEDLYNIYFDEYRVMYIPSVVDQVSGT